MNVSEPFIRRPVGTILLAVGLLLAGLVAYLPAGGEPAERGLSDHPRLGDRPGADPEMMAATVAAPLERASAASPASRR